MDVNFTRHEKIKHGRRPCLTGHPVEKPFFNIDEYQVLSLFSDSYPSPYNQGQDMNVDFCLLLLVYIDEYVKRRKPSGGIGEKSIVVNRRKI